jgi:zinc and cadmium transporter
MHTMGAQHQLLFYVLGVFLAAVLGGALPLLRAWRHNHLHVFVAFGAGVFLGAFFLHLLPDVMRAGSPTLASGLMLTGFLAVLAIERVLLRHHAFSCPDGCPHRHAIVGISSFVGLSAHSLTAGLALGVTVVAPSLGTVIFIAIIAHKATAAFSLATVFRLSNLGLRPALLLLGTFALMTPLGALLAVPLYEQLRGARLVIPTALAAGTFLYVATMDLLPEAFHEGEYRVAPFVAVVAGILVMFVIAQGGA